MMSSMTHFEQVPLEKIKHIVETGDQGNGQNIKLPAAQNHKPPRKSRKRNQAVKEGMG
jgi:hypothetical protein